MEKIKRHRAFNGWVEIWRHSSSETATPMTFSIFLPDTKGKRPALFWLSGLTCNHENFFHKAGALEHASRLGMVLVAPDTSPRGAGILGETGDWEFGEGAGFYLDATKEPYAKHYRMFSYVGFELRQLIIEHFPVDEKRISISGHSMGGHGALVLGLRLPQYFRSISAFAPICAPSLCHWGKKAFAGYFNSPLEGQEWDASILAAKSDTKNFGMILIDQGLEDDYLASKQLLPEEFEQACAKSGLALNLRRQESFDHSYYFISTFIAEHLQFHAESTISF